MTQTDDPHIMHPGHAPTPFTADEIRAGCPQGRTIRLSMETDGASFLQTIRFVAVDDFGAEQESFADTQDGDSLGEPARSRTSWAGFQEHASFPAEATSVEVEALNTSLGKLECRVYTVTRGEEVSRYWFAVDRPGMPVKVQTMAGDRVLSTMDMIEDTVR